MAYISNSEATKQLCLEGAGIVKKLFTFILSTSFSVVLLFISTQPIFAYSTNMSASVVIGQTNFTSSSANQGSSATASTLSGPKGVFVDPNGRLIVADSGNHRVLLWNSVPTSNNTPADLVLGQADFTSSSANRGGTTAANTFNNPVGVYSDGTRLAVSDRANHRVLIWNTFPTSNGQSADIVVGQSNMTTGTVGACNTVGLDDPDEGVWIHNNKLIVSSKDHRRVLIWNSVPTTNGASADVVLGQANFTSCGVVAVSSSSMNQARGMAVDQNGRLYVVDDGRDRVLVWNSVPTTNNQAADIVIGQDNFTSSTGGTSASRFLLDQSGIATDGERVFLADRVNNRIVIFNSLPTSNGASADTVIGQSSFSGSSANGGGSTSASGLSFPDMVFAKDNKLFVSDTGQHRVLIFDNVRSGPQIGINKPSEISDSKLKVNGTVKLGERSKYHLASIKMSVNGEGFGDVTHKDGGRDDGSDSTVYEFYDEFEPWANNGTKETWQERGYTFNIKASSSNAEEDQIFYFLPFTLDPVVGELLPTFRFNVNKYQWDRLKGNLNSYEVHVRKDGESNWITFIDKIQIDSSSYDSTNGIVSVNATKSLMSGKYQVKIVARDKWGHGQESNSVEYTSRGVMSFKPSLSVTSDWFPLQVNKISGVKTGIISSFAKTFPSILYSGSTKPNFEGIAAAGSKVNLLVTNFKDTKSSSLYTVVSLPNSTWTLKPTLLASSIIDMWVTDEAGRANLIPAFQINVVQSTNTASVKSETTEQKVLEPTTIPTPTPTVIPTQQPQEETKRCLWFICL